MLNHTGYLGLALYVASFCCYARILYAPNEWVGRLATLLLAAELRCTIFRCSNVRMGCTRCRTTIFLDQCRFLRGFWESRIWVWKQSTARNRWGLS